MYFILVWVCGFCLRLLPWFLFHVMALVSTVFSLGLIFWGDGLDPFLLTVLLVLSFLPNFVLGGGCSHSFPS